MKNTGAFNLALHATTSSPSLARVELNLVLGTRDFMRITHALSTTAALWLVFACGTDATGSSHDTSVDPQPSSTTAGLANDSTANSGSRSETTNTSGLNFGSSSPTGTSTGTNRDVDTTSSNGTSTSDGDDTTTTTDMRVDAGATSGDDTGTDDSATSGTETSDSSSHDVSDTEENPDDECEFSGNVRYRINDPASFPPDALEKLTKALEQAIYYYNCYSDLSHSLTINYKPSVRTAEGNVDGVISFGSNQGYMVVATVMHEIGHTMGVGYAPWSQLIQDGRWMGPNVNELMTNLPANERDPDSYSQRTYITCDEQHFWPYGLNQASEHQSEWSLINHVRVVAAMNKDKDAFR